MDQPLIVRLGGIRAVSALAVELLIILGFILMLPVTLMVEAMIAAHPTVEIHDEAHVLQVDSLSQSIERLTFSKDVHVAVLTLPGKDVKNLNDEVLEYARASNSTDVPWISPKNPRYWANGLVILAVAPQARFVGCYFGEDVKVSLQEQAEIQNVAKNALRSQDWDKGITLMAQESAQRLGSGRQIGYAVGAAVMSVLGLVWLAFLLHRGRRNRKLDARARRSYSEVTHDYDATELMARTLPPEEPHSAQVLARYNWFLREYEKVTRDFTELGEPRGAQWYSDRVGRLTTRLARRSAVLDTLDDVIANASALLTMSSRWEEAWRTETGPVREDLASLLTLTDRVAEAGTLDVTPVRIWVREQSRWLAQITIDLRERTMSPSQALKELDRMSDRIRATAERLVKDALDADTSRYAEARRRRYQERRSFVRRRPYNGNWSLAGIQGSYDPCSTIRLNPSSPGQQAVDSASLGSVFNAAPLSDLIVGYSNAADYTPASSSGSSFDGSGSSSSFSSGSSFSGSGSSSSF